MISSTEDERMGFILKMADQISEMSSKGKVLVKQISQNTASRFYHTCNGIVSITKRERMALRERRPCKKKY